MHKSGFTERMYLDKKLIQEDVQVDHRKTKAVATTLPYQKRKACKDSL